MLLLASAVLLRALDSKWLDVLGRADEPDDELRLRDGGWVTTCES